jgi:acyl-CoA synthetase (AMP-forming)/AMP-acid ligase II/thioesterase domain-containing protein
MGFSTMESISSAPLHDSTFSSHFQPHNPMRSTKGAEELSFDDLDTDATSTCLQDILKQRAESGPSRSLIVYSLNDLSTPQQISYSTLHELAKQNSIIIRSLRRFKESQPILIHLDDQWDTIVWFWSVLLANGLPVLSSPLSNVDEHRHKYLDGLSRLLESPICITREENLPFFDGAHTLQLEPVEFLSTQRLRNDSPNAEYVELVSTGAERSNDSIHGKPTPPAMLMLTSGSTGNPKAVCLTHQQVLAAIRGKASVRPLPAGHAFLNWIGLDHVASLVEIHLQAMWLGVDQVHIPAPAVVSSPTLFLDLLSRHSVSRSFAPNFFLAKLVSSVEAEPNPPGWDLSSLTVLASGGELNDVKTCVAASAIFERYGATRNVITTGFGMTETCAGAIFNLECPDTDVKNGRSVASLGKCMEGIEMRVTVPASGSSGAGETITVAMPDEPGDLEIRGDVVFEGYFRDTHATADAFTADGWFRTGDQATIDSEGRLHLIGRAKEVININGVKFASSDIQTSVEQAINAHVARVVCFPSRAVHTEQVTVAYIPRKWPMEVEEMAEIEELAGQACIISTGSRPLIFSIREESLSILPISALGKISRAKMTSLFQDGVFTDDVLLHRQYMDKFQKQKQILAAVTAQATTPAESLLIEDFVMTLDVPPDMVGLDTRIFDLGSTSMDMMRLKRRIDTRLGIMIPIIMLMKNPTPRSLAASLQLNYQVQPSQTGSRNGTMEATTITPTIEYDPVVTFSSGGAKTPLWLIHPGVGEVLVFVGLAQYLRNDDRPVYALRARGFEAGQERFASIEETVETYVSAIRQRQPDGPYALAGYSYGAMLAFEVAKKLDAADGKKVQFLGSFNLPPHIKSRMRHLNWNMCLLHLSWFLDVTSEDFTNAIDEHSFRAETRDNALRILLEAANHNRLEELGLEEPELIRWTNVAFGLQSMAVDYEPSGQVRAIDIFHAIPLKVAAASREEWVEKHLSRWSEFSKTEPRFHQVGGAHYTMIGPDHVSSFSETLITALRMRGL